MKKVRLMIELTEEDYHLLKIRTECFDLNENTRLIQAVRNGTPYNLSGDCINRSEIRKAIEKLPNANPSYSHTCDVVERDEVFEIIDNALGVSDQDTIKELWNCRNELCLRCGKYKNAHQGACDDCRYNAKNMSKYKRKRGGAE